MGGSFLFLFLKRKMRSDAMTGIVVGDDGISAATVSRAGKGKPVLEFCSFTTVESREDLEETLGSVVRDSGGNRMRCITVLPRDDYQLMQVEAPDVPSDELRAAIRWRIKEMLDFHIDDAVIDVFEIPGQRRGKAHMMFVVAAHMKRVRERITLLEGAGARLDVIDIEEMALRNLAGVVGEDARGVLMLRFNEDHGLITITQRGNLYLTRRIETGAMETFSAAQQADPESGDYGPELASLLDGVTLEVQRSLDYYDSHFAQSPVSTMIVASSLPELPFIAGYLDRSLQLDVRDLVLEDLLDGELPDDPQVRARCLTAIGAALRHEEVVL